MMDYLKIVVSQGATDLHIESNGSVAMRLYGSIVSLGNCSQEEFQALKERLFLYCGATTCIVKNTPNEVKDFSCALADIGRLRVRCYQSQGHACMAIRFLPAYIPSPDELNWPKVLPSLCLLRQGLILVTGASGSGKSTTLAAFIEHINQNAARHIVTFEAPIEYVFQSKKALIHQCTVPDDVASFADGAKDALRMDADVIMLGELSDLETMRAALKLVESGHLVLATMHTGSAAEAVVYFINHFPASEQTVVCHQLAAMLRGVVSQRLLPHRNENRFVAAYEVLLHNSAVAHQIREKNFSQLTASIELGRGEGMVLLEDSLTELVRQGSIDLSDAVIAANIPERLRQAFAE